MACIVKAIEIVCQDERDEGVAPARYTSQKLPFQIYTEGIDSKKERYAESPLSGNQSVVSRADPRGIATDREERNPALVINIGRIGFHLDLGIGVDFMERQIGVTQSVLHGKPAFVLLQQVFENEHLELIAEP